MANRAESVQVVRFGEFELDLRTGELRTNGHRIVLQEKPFQILAALLEQPGEMVTRERLIKRLWPADTFVDFNLGLNKAVNRLREALDDTAENPRLIETLPKRGYRLMVPTQIALPATDPVEELHPLAKSRTLARGWLHFAVGLGLVCLLVTWFWIRNRDTKTAEPGFQRLSFGRGTIRSARFAPDGQSVIYGAAWGGKPFQLFWTKIGSVESQPLGLDADILAISPSGEMAILMNPRFRMMCRLGTLAIMPLTGRAPRKLLDNVQDADWSPDGSKLAVTHYVGNRCAHLSPRGPDWFLEHPLGFGDDDAGLVAVIDLAGNKKVLSKQFASLSGMAWDPAGDSIWFSGWTDNREFGLFEVTLSGQQRQVRTDSSNLSLRDVSPGRHLLLTRDSFRGEVQGRIYPESTERELGWGDNSGAFDVSPDGSTLALSVQGEASGSCYAVYLRKTDGSPAVRLGDGLPMQFSSDTQWILTTYPSGMRPVSPPQLLLLPTGAGQPVILTHDSLSHGFATLLPDGKRILFEGSEPGHARRNWIQDVSGGKPLPITPEGTSGKCVSQDWKLLVATDPTGRFWIYPTGGGQPRALPGIGPGEDAIRWSPDNRYLLVASESTIPATVSRIEVSTGRRQLIFTLSPSDKAGLWNIGPVLVTPNAKSYVYSDYRILSDLYLASGLK